MIAKGRTFRSGNSEALRLPKEMAFGDNVELTLVRAGDVLTIYPVRPSISSMVSALRTMPKAPPMRREDVEIPDRKSMR